MSEIKITRSGGGKKPGEWDCIRILVVDDEESVCESLKMILGIKDYEVVTVLSGFEALEAIKKDVFDIVLTDIRMPGMDGLELLRKIKEIDSDIEVIIVTAYPSLDNSVEAMRLGALDFLTKPFLMEQVYQMVDRAFRKRKTSLLRKKLLEAAETESKTEGIDELEAVRRISEIATTAPNLRETIEGLISLMSEVVDYHVLTLLLPERNEIYIHLHQPITRGYIKKLVPRILEHAEEYGAQIKDPNQIIFDEKGLLQEKEEGAEAGSFVGAPLKIKGKAIGLFTVSSPEKDVFSRKALTTFTAVANQAALAIENAMLHEKLQG